MVSAASALSAVPWCIELESLHRGESGERGDRSFELLRAGLRPCLILLDLRMPRKSGLEFRAEQERDAQLAHIPTVIVSATDGPRKLTNLVRVLPKPMPVEQLLAIVQQHCSKLVG